MFVELKRGGLGFEVLKLQLLLVLLVLLQISRSFIGFELFLVFGFLSSAYFFYVIFMQVRVKSSGDWVYTLVFFGVLWLLIQAVWVLQGFTSAEMFGFGVIGVLGALIVFVLLFRVLFGRKYVMGRVVMCKKGEAVVETDFDIRTFTPAGKYVVKSEGKCAVGQDVKVGFGFAGLGGKPKKIIE